MGSFRSTLVVGSALCMLVSGAGSALAGGNPPGNNGTVKVDGMPFEQSQANEPHVGCAFAIDFFGFDQGALDRNGDVRAPAADRERPPPG